MTEKILSFSTFRAHGPQLMEDIRASGSPVILTHNGAAAGVVQDYKSYEAQKQALLMLKLMAQGEADIRAGRVTAQDAVFDALDVELDAME